MHHGHAGTLERLTGGASMHRSHGSAPGLVRRGRGQARRTGRGPRDLRLPTRPPLGVLRAQTSQASPDWSDLMAAAAVSAIRRQAQCAPGRSGGVAAAATSRPTSQMTSGSASPWSTASECHVPKSTA